MYTLNDSTGVPAPLYTAGYRTIDETPPITTEAQMYIPTGAPPMQQAQMGDINFDLGSLIVPALAFFAGYMVAKNL